MEKKKKKKKKIEIEIEIKWIRKGSDDYGLSASRPFSFSFSFLFFFFSRPFLFVSQLSLSKETTAGLLPPVEGGLCHRACRALTLLSSASVAVDPEKNRLQQTLT